MQPDFPFWTEQANKRAYLLKTNNEKESAGTACWDIQEAEKAEQILAAIEGSFPPHGIKSPEDTEVDSEQRTCSGFRLNSEPLQTSNHNTLITICILVSETEEIEQEINFANDRHDNESQSQLICVGRLDVSQC